MAVSESALVDIEWLERMLLGWVEWAATVPLLSSVVSYIASSLHRDPWRLFLEVFMLGVLIRYMVGKRYRPKESFVRLSSREVDDLVKEWTPEPLVTPLPAHKVKRDVESIPVIEGKVTSVVRCNGKELLNFASYNHLGLVGDERIEKSAVETLRKYGVGSCGPPGFYGTLDVHMELEQKIAKILGTEEAILYSYAFSTIASAIPAFAKRDDLLVCDEGIGFALQKGVLVSRAQVRYFKHNDMADLENVLKSIKEQDQREKKRLNRRFIITEGLFQNHGDICPLPQLVQLKSKYKLRLIVDESFSFGVLGKTGLGICQHFNIPSKDVDVLTGSLAHSIGAAGGYCTGSVAVVDHQRLSGQGYCYSASMPAMLAVSASRGLDFLTSEPERVEQLRKNTSLLRKLLKDEPTLQITGADVSPVVFIRPKQSLADREAEEDLLQEVVNKAMDKGVLVTRHKMVMEEIRPPAPCLRVNVSQAHTEQQISTAAEAILSSFREVLSSRGH